jgi:hypothetical protein
VRVWHLWDARNAVHNDEKRIQHNLVEKMILMHLFKPPSAQRSETPSPIQVRSPSPVGNTILNVDVTFFFSSSRLGVGDVISNHNGKLSGSL